MTILHPSMGRNSRFTVNETGDSGHVTGQFGEGGQGQVFRCQVGDRDLALKIYHPHYITDFPHYRKVIKKLTQMSPPSPRYIWPEATIRVDGKPNMFGYIMPLKPTGYFDALDYISHSRPIRFRELLRASSQVAKALELLHARGLCYRDINYNNIAVHPDHGDSTVFDNDNVVFDDPESADNPAPFFPGCVAKEVIDGSYRPSSDGDRHSLAVLYFFLFFRHNPLEGKKVLDCPIWGAEEMEQFCKDPLYIFDPEDNSNKALPKSEDDPEGIAGHNALYYRSIYPDWFMEPFNNAFTVGLHQRHRRVLEQKWRTVFDLLGHQVIYCSNPTCNENEQPLENFYRGEKRHHCRKCKGEIVLPPRIRIVDSENVYVLAHDTCLRARHIGSPTDFKNPDEVLATVKVHPEKKIWGLRNDSSQIWQVQVSDGSDWVGVDRGKHVALTKPRIKIDFCNGRKGIIRVGVPRVSDTR